MKQENINLDKNIKNLVRIFYNEFILNHKTLAEILGISENEFDIEKFNTTTENLVAIWDDELKISNSDFSLDEAILLGELYDVFSDNDYISNKNLSTQYSEEELFNKITEKRTSLRNELCSKKLVFINSLYYLNSLLNQNAHKKINDTKQYSYTVHCMYHREDYSVDVECKFPIEDFEIMRKLMQDAIDYESLQQDEGVDGGAELNNFRTIMKEKCENPEILKLLDTPDFIDIHCCSVTSLSDNNAVELISVYDNSKKTYVSVLETSI